jgi:hypothetical protein
VPLDEIDEQSPARWWGFMEKVVADQEGKGEPVEAVGKILFG